MLKVVKIVEGGINLETREELPRSIVISNGRREVHVPVNDNVIRELIGLFADNGEPEELLTKAPNPPPQRPPPPSPRPVVPTAESQFEGGLFDEAPDDDGFEPGEEFEDSGTGASSL